MTPDFFGGFIFGKPDPCILGQKEVFPPFRKGKNNNMKLKQTKRAINLRALCESAILVALATVFSLLRFPPFRIDLWAQGGSIDFVMVPIIILGWRRGFRWAIPAGLALGLIECLIAGGIGWGLPSVLLDYVLAYGAVGLAGFFRNEKWGLPVGAVVAAFARFVIHYISGVTIYKIAVGESVGIFGMTFGDNMSYLYSLVYNGSYMLGNMIIALIIVFILQAPLRKLPK
jgi:thiamine transporter